MSFALVSLSCRARASSACLGALLLASLATAASAQAIDVDAPRTGRAHATRVDASVRIDGRLDEPFWRTVRPVGRFVQREPRPGASASKRTDVRMAITDDAVIIGAWLEDDNAILTALQRDSASLGGAILPDYFRVQIDPHRGHQTIFEFIVTIRGETRSSLALRNGAVDSWNVHWEVASRAVDDGWAVEIRIPISELHVRPGEEQWGVAFERFSWKRMETDVLEHLAPSQRVASASTQR